MERKKEKNKKRKKEKEKKKGKRRKRKVCDGMVVRLVDGDLIKKKTKVKRGKGHKEKGEIQLGEDVEVLAKTLPKVGSTCCCCLSCIIGFILSFFLFNY